MKQPRSGSRMLKAAKRAGISLLALVLVGFAWVVIHSRARRESQSPSPPPAYDGVPSLGTTDDTQALPGTPVDEELDDRPASGQNVPEVKRPETREGRPRIPRRTDIAAESLSKDVRIALGIEAGPSGIQRDAVAGRLPRDLTRPEIEAIYAFLAEPWTQEERLSLGAQNSLKNELLVSLIYQDAQPADLEDAVFGMFSDPAMDDWWRDFIVQHLAALYSSAWSIPGEPAQYPRDAVPYMTAYRQAFTEIDTSIAGTALLSYERVSREHPEFDRSELANQALTVAANPEASLLSRVGAVQVAGLVEDARILPLARRIVAESDSIPLKLAAIASMAMAGDEEVAPYLRALVDQGDRYTQKAARGALASLERRTGRATQ